MYARTFLLVSLLGAGAAPNAPALIAVRDAGPMAVHTPAPGNSQGAQRSGRGWRTWAGTGMHVAGNSSGGHRGSNQSTGAVGLSCTYTPSEAPAGKEARKGTWYLRSCRVPVKLTGIRYETDNIFVPEGEALPTVTPYELALQAMRALRLPLPAARTAPPRGAKGVVGLRHYFWVERSQWITRTRRAEAGAVWAEVIASPTKLTFSAGTDQPSKTCAGPGTPYDKRMAISAQKIDCSHLFTRSSAGLVNSVYQASVRVTWNATWVGSGGTGGTLPVVTTSTTFPIRVAEGQALVQKRSK